MSTFALLLCGLAHTICLGATNTYGSWRLSDASPGGVDLNASVEIAATPEVVFRTLTDCGEAMKFVPHLEHCEVLESAPDGSWQIVEHRVDHGWFAPKARYVFRAEYEGFRRIRFSNVSGDLRENRGTWEFQPSDDGTSTLVTYNAHVVPRKSVPRWLLRSALRSDLPALMKGLRTACESPRGPVQQG